MPKFRKKPVVIEAIRWVGDNEYELIEFGQGSIEALDNPSPDYLTVHTLEGDLVADLGDWIIKGVRGEFYPCKPDIFERTYDAVTDGEE